MHSCLSPEKLKTRRCPESFAAHQWCISLGPLACDIRPHPLDRSPRPMVECNGKLSGGMLGVTEAVVINQELKKRWEIVGVVKSCGELSGVVKGVWEHRGLSQIVTDCASSSALICASDRASDSVHQSAHQIAHQVLCIRSCASVCASDCSTIWTTPR